MNILLVTDAWAPQVNGVVRTLERTRESLAELGHRVTVLSPSGRTLPCPGYPEIRLALRPAKLVRRAMADGPFDAVHIATEGPLGLAASRWCRRHRLPFTTSYHTRFPEYLRMRAPVPLAVGYAYMRWFHSRASRTLVRTATQKTLLAERGFRNLRVWPGGVDTQLFRPRECDSLRLPRPIALYAGRVALEKNLDAFLALDLPGSKVVIGDGPALAELRRRYPDTHFLGYRHGEELAELMSSADVFVFPSRTDTFGLVVLESMACGVPVAAFPVPGPGDLITDGGNGALDEDLREAVFRALSVDGDCCAEFAARFSWGATTGRFLSLLAPLDEAAAARRYNPAPCHSPPPAPKPASIGLPN
jgi:glycosyltransferase involved in cell wall biosynthesis